MTFKLSLAKLFKPLRGIAFVAVVVTGVSAILEHGLDGFMIKCFAGLFGVMALPMFYLIVHYYYNTKNMVVEITPDTIISTELATGETIREPIKDLVLIKLFKSKNMEEVKRAKYSTENYYYAEIFIRDKKVIILTSVMEPSIDVALGLLKDVKVKFIPTALATITWGWNE